MTTLPRRRWRSPLGRRIIGLFSAVIAVTMLGTMAVIARQQISEAHQDLRERASTLTEMLARNAEFGVYTRNVEALAGLGRSLAGENGLLYVRFMDRDSQVIYQNIVATGAPLPELHDTRLTVGGHTAGLLEDYHYSGGPVLDAVAEVRSATDSGGLFSDPTAQAAAHAATGYLQLGLSLAPLGVRAHHLLGRLLVVAIVALLFGLVASLLLTQRIVAPVLELVEATRAVKEGRLDHRITVRTRDELETLAGAFNEMVDDLKRYRGQVEESQRTLEDKVDQRTTELQSATSEAQRLAEEAQAASRAKSQFLANMSHEIRTPMNGVIGMLEVLNRSSLDAAQRRFVGIATGSAEALLRIISDILDFSKVEAGKLTIHPVEFDLRALIEDIGEMLAPQAHAKRVELACWVSDDVPAWVRGDASRLRQILVNLAGNAVKFTESGEVVIRARVIRSGAIESVVRIEVQDTGIGISPETQVQLFNPFVQADGSLTRRFGGTGLGLAIAKQLTELMSGSIAVESTPGQGSTFAVTLPFPRVDRVPDCARRTLDGVRILVVDDNATNREILVQQAASWGVVGEAVPDGPRALARLDRPDAPPVDLVILDLMMPGMDGLALARRIRADARYTRLPLLLLTSVEEPTESELGQTVDAVLSKPIRSQDLRERVAALLGRGQHGAPSRPAEVVSSGPLGARVLVAEDNEVNQEVALAYLAMLGCHVTIANDGVEAVARARDGSFDLILMDCMMPRLDGFGATRAIRELEAAAPDRQRLPIVALTASALLGEREKCLAAGMDDFLTKPLALEDLRQMVARSIVVAHRTGPDEPVTGPSSPDPGAAAQGHLDAAALDRLRQVVTADGRTLLNKLIGVFLVDVPTRLKALSDAMRRGDAAEVRLIAHTLKSSAATLGAGDLAANLAELEIAGLEGDSQRWSSLMPVIEAEQLRAAAALTAVREMELAHA
jgi:signal transduction histidine kinase/DNA-binding response OmpR family regulator